MAWNNIEGRAAYLWIYSEFLKEAPQDAVIVEVGVALGKSIAFCATEAIRLGRRDITIVAVDSWEGIARNGEQQASGPPTPDGDYELFLETMKRCCPEALNRIHIMRARSTDAAKRFAPQEIRSFRGSNFPNISTRPKRPNLVVLDAAHDYKSVCEDIAAWKSVLAPEGWMGGDDYVAEYQGVIDAVGQFFAPEGGDRVEVRHDEGWGTWLVRGA